MTVRPNIPAIVLGGLSVPLAIGWTFLSFFVFAIATRSASAGAWWSFWWPAPVPFTLGVTAIVLSVRGARNWAVVAGLLALGPVPLMVWVVP